MKEMNKADKILLRREVDSLESVSYKSSLAIVLIVLFQGLFKDNFVCSLLDIIVASWFIITLVLLAKNYYLNYFLVKEEYVNNNSDLSYPETWNASRILYE